MRLHEIDDIDKTWANSAGVNLDILDEYNEAMNIIAVLKISNSAKRNAHFAPRLDEIEDNLERIINSEFADDISTKELKLKAHAYINELREQRGGL